MNNSSTDQIKSLEDSVPKKSHFWKWFWGVTLVLIVLCFWVIGSQFRTVPLRISKETTYVTGPLKSDGKSVDFLRAFEAEHYSDKIATDENGYRLFVRRFGKAPDSRPAEFANLCEKLNLDPESISADVTTKEPYEVFNEYLNSALFDKELIRKIDAEMNGESPASEPYATKTYDEYEILDVLETRVTLPWTLDDLPFMKVWIPKGLEVVKVLDEAVRFPVFEIPIERANETDDLLISMFSETQRMRSIARISKTCINYQIGTGDIDGAITGIVACKKLGRRLQRRAAFVDLLVGVAIEGTADSIGIASSTQYQPNQQQLEKLQNAINNLPGRADFDKILHFERLAILSQIQDFSLNGVNSDYDEIKSLSRFGINWNIVAKRVNERFDQKTVLEVDALEEPSLVDLFSITRRSRICGDSFLGFYSAVLEAELRTQCSNHLQQITLAMLLYEKDHGTLPPAFTVDENDNPLHSWRVLLLPYLGQKELYNKLNLDEPWDSSHNKKFWNENLPFYRCPSNLTAKPGQTTYSVVVGAESAFGGAVGKKLDSFGAYRDVLILVVERLNPICWMNPLNEIPLAIADSGINAIDPKTGKKIGGLASEHPSGIQFGLGDGSVQFVSEAIEQDELKAMLRGKSLGRRVLQ